MPSTSPDVFLEPGDELSGATTANGYGVVRVRAASSVHIFSKDPDQFEALAEACMEAARDLRAVLAPSLSSLIDGDHTAAASKFLAEQKAERQHELNTAGWDAVDGEVAS